MTKLFIKKCIFGMMILLLPALSDRNNSDALPTFFHIPKTGGESVELVLGKQGIMVGQLAFSHNMLGNVYNASLEEFIKTNNLYIDRRGYTLSNDSQLINCSAWHIPPSAFVPKSLVLIRDPMKRVISEICFRYRHNYYPDELNSTDCGSINRYINNTLYRYHNLSMRGVDDCHWIPQWEYAKYASKIYRFDKIKSRRFWNTTLSNHFQVPIQRGHASSTNCPKSTIIKLSCLNEGNLRNLLNHFSADYTNLKKYIKYTDINRNHSMNRVDR